MNPSSEPWVHRWLHRLATAVYRHPRPFLYPQLLLFGACIYFAVTHLQFKTNREDLIGSRQKYNQDFLAFKREFPVQDDLVVVVQSANLQKNRQFVERLGARLETQTNLFTDVFYRGDFKMLGRKALLFMPVGELKDLRDTLATYRPFIQTFTEATNLDSLFRVVNREFRTASPQQNSQTTSLIDALPALKRIVQQASVSLHQPGPPLAPAITALFNAGQQAVSRQYITFDHGRIFIVTARARSDDLNAEAVRHMRELVSQTKAQVPGVNVGLTGEPVLELDEMAQSQRDTFDASILSLFLVALIFVYGYRETGRPIKATFCLIIGLGYTIGYATLTVGYLNILTITFVPMLIGLAIDFGVHLVTRYEEELRRGKSEQIAIHKAIVQTGTGIFTGCFTTAGAFFAMALTNFKGVREMGIITGGGMLVCLIPMMTLLPVLLLKGRQNRLEREHPAGPDARARLERLWLNRPKLVLVLTLLTCGIAATQIPVIHFDYNLLHMQSKGLPAVLYEQKLIKSADKSLLYGAVIADSLTQATNLQARLERLSTVASVESMAPYLSENPAPKLALIHKIKGTLKGIEFKTPASRPVDLHELSQTLTYLQSYLGLASQQVKSQKDQANLYEQLRSLRQAVTRLQLEITGGNPRTVAPKLTAYQETLFRDIRETFNSLKDQDDQSGLHISDLPPALRHQFIGKSGQFLLQVYPKKDVWDRKNQEVFVRQLRTIDPNVTGTPVQLYEYETILKNSYIEAAGYALAAIVLLVLIHFHTLLSVPLVLMPVAIGSLWTLGFMGWRNVPFNPANIMTLPLVIGIGVTNGIHILNRFSEEASPHILAKSTGKAVIVSGLTTIAGFGSLIIAKHRGISSLGFVMSVGVACCMLAGLTCLPCLLTQMIRWGWRLKKTSAENALPTLDLEEPR